MSSACDWPAPAQRWSRDHLRPVRPATGEHSRPPPTCACADVPPETDARPVIW